MYIVIGLLWLIFSIIKEKVDDKKINEAIKASKGKDGRINWVNVNERLGVK